MRSTNVAENSRKCDYMLNVWSRIRQIDVDEKDCNKTFRVPLTDHVILRMRRNSYILTQGRASFSQITLIIFIVEPPMLYSE